MDLPGDAYRSLFEAARDGLFVADSGGRYLAVNPGGHLLLGYGPGELVGRTIEDIVRSGDRARLSSEFARVLAGAPHALEWTLVRKDGGLLRTEVVAQRLPDGNVLAIVRDLSAREAVDADLRASEERLRATLESTPDVGIQWYDETGRVLFWNGASERMFGFSSGEARGRTLDQLIHTPEEAAGFVAVLRRVRASGRPYGPEEIEFRRSGGTGGVCLSTIFEIPGEGGKPWFVCMDVDLTARKQAERALRDSETRLRSYFELPLVGIAITSPEKGWIEVNDRLCDMLGYAREELTRLTWSELTHPEDLKADVVQFERVLNGEIEGYSMEKRFLRKDGSAIYASLSVRCARRSDRSVDYFIALLQDVTDRKRMEEHLRQLQKEESIGRLAGGVAHDFNNLLTSILGFAELARAAVPAGSPAFHDLGRVVESAVRGASLTQQLLAFARRKIVSLQPADLNAVVHRMSPLLRRLLGEDVALEFRAEPCLPVVRVDVGTFEQVLMNLAVNGRDAMPRGGRLRIETSRMELDASYVRDHPGATVGPYVRVDVSDTGIGMTAPVLARLFEPFFTTKPVGQGTGLGLAVVQGIVRQAGGHVTVESEAGKGSRFSILLPQSDGIPPAPAVETTIRSRAMGSETLLVVEDDPSVLELARQILAGHGYRVLAAPEGETALEIARTLTDPLHLLLTDVIMPGMNGSELAIEIRRIRPGIRVLFASGYPADALSQQGGFDAGAGLIQKPYTPATLAARIREALDRPE